MSNFLLQGLDASSGQLEISERGEIVLSVNVSNFGEPAYSATLDLTVDGSLSYVGRSDDVSDVHCDVRTASTSEHQVVTCQLGNPYPSNRYT